MYVLGLKPSFGQHDTFDIWGYHDGSACLIDDEEIVAAAEEERFTRQKRAEHTFPTKSVQYVLDEANIRLSDVDVVAVGRDPRKRVKYHRKNPMSLLPTSPRQALHVVENLKAVAAAFKNIHIYRVDQKLQEATGEEFTGEYYSISHHLAHAASAYYCSPATKPITLTIDAKGEHDSTVLWDRDLNRVKEFSRDNSIGFLYSYGTQYLGYRHGGDAGKVMGLASYGEHREDFERKFSSLVDIGYGDYDVTAITDVDDPVAIFEEHFGPRRVYPDEFTQRHRDFAYHLQKTTEEIAEELVRYHVEQQGTADVALAGGIAMNCKMNRGILELECVDDLFIQPAANDSGICIGAALQGYREVTGEQPDIEFWNVYFGPSYANEQIKAILDSAKLEYEKRDDIAAKVAELLAAGKLVGWFQGRMEFGARALGNRSILADPTTEESRDRVNENVKHREQWRPFAPSLLHEARDEYLKGGEEAPFMILLDTVPEDKREEIPAVTHVDNTTRPQTVREEVNRKYYRLIKEFETRTGTPVVLNTSFNVAGEPIVESPEQALQDFFSTGLDALALGDYLIRKPSVED